MSEEKDAFYPHYTCLSSNYVFKQLYKVGVAKTYFFIISLEHLIIELKKTIHFFLQKELGHYRKMKNFMCLFGFSLCI